MRPALSFALLIAILLAACGPRKIEPPPAPSIEVLQLTSENRVLRERVGRLEAALAEAAGGKHVCTAMMALDELEDWRRSDVVKVTPKPMPPIETIVTKLTTEGSVILIELNAGRVSGVEKGFQFTIYRATTFVGKVVVERVLDGSCSARILFTAPDQRIGCGDSAATRLD